MALNKKFKVGIQYALQSMMMGSFLPDQKI